MKYDEYGQLVLTCADLFAQLYQRPDLDFNNVKVTDPEQYNASLESLHLDSSRLEQYKLPSISVSEFDRSNQNNWLMPDTYANFDIAEWVLHQCQSEPELQRAGQELLLFQERNLFPLLNYLKYLVDTMREHNIVWGVGRGSSVASFVLYKIGVHHINSLYYDLDIHEFLKV